MKKTIPVSASPPAGRRGRPGQKQPFSEHLKTADRLIKSGNLDSALEEIQKALSIDPRNIYARAYEARIKVLQEEARKKEREAQAGAAPGERESAVASDAEKETQRKREEELRRLAEEEAKRLKEEEARRAQEEAELRRLEEEALRASWDEQRRGEEEARQKAQAELQAKVENAQRKLEDELEKEAERRRKHLEEETHLRAEEAPLRAEAEARKKQEEVKIQLEKKLQEEIKVAKEVFQEELERVESERKRLEESLQKKAVDDRKVLEERARDKLKKEKVAAYRQLLKQVWSEGGVSRQEALLLKTMRRSLQISLEEHGEIELEVKLSSYIATVRDAWKQGFISPEDADLLDNLRRLYDIDAEQHLKIESKVRKELGERRGKGLVLVVDDEVSITKFAELILAKEGYSVIIAESVENALDLLEESKPALILSDINFPQPGMGGFSFFEKLRQMEHVKLIPFILMSAINEELIIQTGKRLGISDYLIKPFTRETLITSVEKNLKN